LLGQLRLSGIGNLLGLGKKTLQFFTQFEVSHALGWNFNGLPRLWIATSSRAAFPLTEGAETSEFYLITFLQRVDHSLKDLVYYRLCIFDRQLGCPSYLLN